MRVLIAPDKFKGSLTAKEVCEVIAEGILAKQPSWQIVKSPLADGGEGTCEILTGISGGRIIKAKVRDPLFRETVSHYGLSQDGKTAFIEMASASGLQLLKPAERNPRLTSSIGTGDLIADALSHRIHKIIIGCGGSATNDGGIGMATALGFSFHDAKIDELKPIGENLALIQSINFEKAHSGIANCEFVLLSDVSNPFTGINGAAFVYARQKGASESDIVFLDESMKNFAKVLDRYYPSITDFPGAGAAGGFPVSAKAFLKAEIKLGIEYVMNFSGIEEKIKSADLVITGEGKFDEQSLQGKVVSGIAEMCRQYNKRLWVICGISEVAENQWKQLGIEKVIAISSDTSFVEESMKNAAKLIQDKMSNAFPIPSP